MPIPCSANRSAKARTTCGARLNWRKRSARACCGSTNWYVDFHTQAERENIVRIHLKKRIQRLRRIDYAQLAQKTGGFTGADIELVVKEAVKQAFVDNKTDVSTELILKVIDATSPLLKM